MSTENLAQLIVNDRVARGTQRNGECGYKECVAQHTARRGVFMTGRVVKAL